MFIQCSWPVFSEKRGRATHGQEEKLKVLRADELAKVEAASRVGDYDIANVTVGESIGMIHDLPHAGDVRFAPD